MKTLRWLGAACAALIALTALSACKVDKAALAQHIDLHNVDLAKVQDGTYDATYTIDTSATAANKTVSVRVTVAGGRYAAVELLVPAALVHNKNVAALAGRIVADQALSIDAVSGATVTGAAILKAVQIAVSPK